MPSARKMVFLLMLLALVAVPVAAFAQTSNETIAIGDTVEGSLETGHLSAQYVLSGNRGDEVTITLTSDAFDAYLTLLDPGLNEVAADDDSGGGTNPEIADFTLDTTGEFTIVVDSFNRLQTGDFTLTVSGSAAPESSPTPDVTSSPNVVGEGESIVLGDTVSGTIAADVGGIAYTFEASMGQAVTIDLISTAFDSYLVLRDSSGQDLVDDDDSAGNLNARIEGFVIPANGEYSIIVGGYGGGVEGDFTLSLQDAGMSIVPLTETPAPTTVVDMPPTWTPAPTTVTTDGGDGTISIGGNIAATLPEGEGSASYTFNGQAGQLVTITLESAAFDAYIELLDEFASVIAEDDDSAGNLNARVENFELPADSEYTIRVGSFGGDASGDYTLSLTSGEVAVIPTIVTMTPSPTTGPTFTSSGGPIEFGVPVNGTLPENTRAATYTFSASAGDVVTINLSSTDFDSYLTLLDPSGAEVAYDDDRGGNLNARIENLVLPTDGEYTIEATSLGSFVTGSFTLSLETGVAGIEPTPVPTTVPLSSGAISLGDTVNGELTGTESEFTFEGSTGQIVMLTLESNDFDAFLTLKDPAGSEIASDDDSAGSLNARIANFALPSDGTYTLVVGGSSAFSSGSFTLSTATASIQPPITATSVLSAPPGTISLGETVNSSLNDGPNAHTFEGQRGQIVTITLESIAFDAYLQLKDANGIELASDDDSAGNLNAQIDSFLLPSDGTYAILVSSFDNTASGDYTLSLTGSSGSGITPTVAPFVSGNGQIAFGETVNGTLSDSLSAQFTFQGEAGQMVTITASAEDFDTYLRLRDSNGTDLSTDDDSAGSLDSRIGFYRLPSNDTYTIVVESYDSEPGDYSLSLSAAEVRPIEYTQTVNGELTASATSAGYRFTGQAGDTITITLRSGSFDAYLSLIQANASDSYALTTDDDSGGGSDSRIGPFSLPETGDYIISVSSYDSTVLGAYTLELGRAVLTPIDFDQPAAVQVDAGAQYFSFEGKTGDVITISATSGGSVDTSLSLIGPDNYQLIEDDDSGPDFDPEINRLVLTTDGTYTIVLQPYVAGDSGAAILTLSRTPLRSLDNGPQDVRLNDKSTQDVLTFTAVAGQNYQLWIEVQSGVASPEVTITQGGTTVATGSASSSTALLVAFVVPESGAVTVQINDYSYEKVVMNVRVEAVGQ